METKLLCASSYGLLSLYRSRLMGLAMLFHAYELKFGLLPLDAFKAAGFAGVDIFLLLSGMGLHVSLSQANNAVGYCPHTTHARLFGSCRPTGLWWEPIACGCASAAVSP